jgi:hypothetical protein
MDCIRRIVPLTLLAALAAASACDSVTERCGASTQDEALNCLGVPEDDSDRVDITGAPLPQTYAPLGATATVGASLELFVLGPRVAPPVPAGEPEPLDSRAVMLELSDDETGAIGPTVIDTWPAGTTWEGDDRSGHPSSLAIRDAAAPDLDGDGIDEVVVAYLDFDDPVNAGVVFMERAAGGTPRQVVSVDGARDVALARADVDGDGKDELVLAVTSAVAAHLFVVEVDDMGRFAIIEAASKILPRITSSGGASVELATGNIDRDNGEEIVVVLNEPDTTSYAIIDDASAGFADLVTGGIVRVQDGGNFEARVADVAIGDVDADGKGEIIFAGLTDIDNQTCRSHQHVYLVLDDAGDSPEPLAPIAQKVESIRYVASGCDEIAFQLPVYHVFVEALDVDGDGVDEILANLRVFDDLRAGAFVELYALDQEVLAGEFGRGGSALSPSTTSITVADIDGNGRDDIIVFAQHMRRIVVWGLDGPSIETAVFREMTALETAFYNSQSRVFPVLVPANVDSDGAVLKYSEAEYRFVFTEPIILAAIAAAPCAENIGQNLAACSTAYGTSESVMGGVDGTVSVSAGVFVSFEAKDPLLGIGAAGRAGVTVTASFSASQSYTLTESVEYSTGPLEDTVVFTTLPLDQYTYEVVAHPDPEMVGQTITVNLPRTPVTLQVEREFYNNSVVEGSFQVGPNVFLHTPGDLDSYPTEADADTLIDTGGLGHIGPLGDVIDLVTGESLEPLLDTLLGAGLKTSRPITVGQGAGKTSTEIVFTEETSYRAGAEIAFEAELAVTGPVGVGGTIGGSVGAGLSWGTSSSTLYRGTIGSISGDGFAENLYSTGLFTYIYNYGKPSSQQFEVVSYWVTR